MLTSTKCSGMFEKISDLIVTVESDFGASHTAPKRNGLCQVVVALQWVQGGGDECVTSTECIDNLGRWTSGCRVEFTVGNIQCNGSIFTPRTDYSSAAGRKSDSHLLVNKTKAIRLRLTYFWHTSRSHERSILSSNQMDGQSLCPQRSHRRVGPELDFLALVSLTPRKWWCGGCGYLHSIAQQRRSFVRFRLCFWPGMRRYD